MANDWEAEIGVMGQLSAGEDPVVSEYGLLSGEDILDEPTGGMFPTFGAIYKYEGTHKGVAKSGFAIPIVKKMEGAWLGAKQVNAMLIGPTRESVLTQLDRERKNEGSVEMTATQADAVKPLSDFYNGGAWLGREDFKITSWKEDKDILANIASGWNITGSDLAKGITSAGNTIGLVVIGGVVLAIIGGVIYAAYKFTPAGQAKGVSEAVGVRQNCKRGRR